MTPRHQQRFHKPSLCLRASAIYLVLVPFALFTSDAHAIVTSDTPGSHVVQPGAITFGMNLDGIARVEIGLPDFDTIFRSGSAALISDRHIITAAHVLDEDADGQVDSFPFEPILRFSANFDAPGGPATISFTKTSVRLMPDWPDRFADLAIVELDQPAPAGIPRYPLYGVTDELSQPTVVAGYGFTGHGSTGATDDSSLKRAGLNRFEAYGEDIDLGIAERMPPGAMLVIDFDSGLTANNTLQTHLGMMSDLGFGADEVIPAHGDSGGPVFIGGAIAGITSAGFDDFPTDATPDIPGDSAWGAVGFNTRVSSFREFITTASDGQAVFVPEPGTWLLLATGLLSTALVWAFRF
jgi:hypothetical protein